VLVKNQAKEAKQSAAAPPPKWSNVFNFNQPAKEKRHDEPALGES
jgi:hypothetical protein